MGVLGCRDFELRVSGDLGAQKSTQKAKHEPDEDYRTLDGELCRIWGEGGCRVEGLFENPAVL